ncbi:ribonuclease Y-like [Littorina saxatilis]|uniref:ribonuclease Y-like n=1 Tax=Littorina saxatilis TaxID=31220 RepID=UPI0038B48F2E
MKSKLMQYRQKLDDNISIVNATAASATVQAEIEQAEERLAKLKEKKEYTEQNPEETEKICGGSLERDLKEKIAELNSQSDQLVGDVKELQKKIDCIRSKQEQAKQATSVLQKRNVAQVLCLKRQVKQQQLRHRQWIEQSRMMQQNVDALKQKLKSL